ncbi:MAG: hypothetical protein ACRDD8_06395 [Bacteroidales bacterium]
MEKEYKVSIYNNLLDVQVESESNLPDNKPPLGVVEYLCSRICEDDDTGTMSIIDGDLNYTVRWKPSEPDDCEYCDDWRDYFCDRETDTYCVDCGKLIIKI